MRIHLRRDSGRYTLSMGPWVHRKWVAQSQGEVIPDQLDQLIGPRGEALAWGIAEAKGNIAFRILSWGELAPEADWLERNLQNAVQIRSLMNLGDTNTAYRLVHGDSDALPGLKIDRCGEYLRMRIENKRAEHWQQRCLSWLIHHWGPKILIETEAPPENPPGRDRSDLSETNAEDPLWAPEGIALPNELHFHEHGLLFFLPCLAGERGNPLPQYREIRQRVAKLALQNDAPLLDLGSHFGAMAIHAANFGAQVIALEKDALRLQFAIKSARANGIDNINWLRGDLFEASQRVEVPDGLGTVVMDPGLNPQNPRELRRAIPRLTQLAFDLMPKIRRGGYIVFCSRSPLITDESADRLLLEAACAQEGETQRWLRVARWGPGQDIPRIPCHPEQPEVRALVYQRR